MKIEIELPEISGFEYTGEYRHPKLGEFFIYNLEYGKGQVKECFVPAPCDCDRFIMKKLKPKREFKDGAFYPFLYNDLHTVGSFCAIDDRISGLRVIDPNMVWIGEELVIKWGEG